MSPDPDASVNADVNATSAATFAATLELVEGVGGWMTDGQAAELFDAARRCPPSGRIVEIGSFQGRSTIVLASAAAPGAEVVAIDPHAGNDRGPQEIDGFSNEAADDHATFTENLRRAGVADRVRHLRAFSGEAHAAVDDPIDVLYVDGAHRYSPARADIAEWGARVTPGGTMLIHDSFSSIGVTSAIGRELLIGRRFRYVGRSRSLAVYRADLEPGFVARGVNASRQLAQLPWFVRNLALKAALSAGYGRVAARLGWNVPQWPY